MPASFSLYIGIAAAQMLPPVHIEFEGKFPPIDDRPPKRSNNSYVIPLFIAILVLINGIVESSLALFIFDVAPGLVHAGNL